ncbi:lipase [Pseudactinotalea sp. HY160]|uniref:GDSL-type esterase/lipase family protein n=1 Tax=Pseudactinotalea sp. HY160 TaxID=2654490 RepID=UPI00128BF484|nr:GDSL-type esterase/lipase family protein [Pseudactinotalea sp. HY160]MPV50266.1 lipase [Pseudactinotalea sp. HY160]
MTPTHAIPLTDDYVRGALRLEGTARGVAPWRLDEWALRQAADPRLRANAAQTAGVRVALRTRATSVELTARRSRATFAGLEPRPDGVVELVVDSCVMAEVVTSGGTVAELDPLTGAVTMHEGEPFTARFDGLGPGEKTIELWLPHNEATELIEVRANAPAEPAPSDGPRWLHHGSSIGHGSNATRPTGTWAAAAARSAGAELTNLGFGGSALLDPFMARTIRDRPADVISLELGINLVTSDVMRLRAMRTAVHGYLDQIRDGHPSAPLLVISPIHCGIVETTPGPAAFDPDALAEGRVVFTSSGDPAEVAAGRLTLETIRAELARIVAERRAEDEHLHYLDGLALFGADDAARLPLPDALHPGPEAHRLMGERFARSVFGGGAFAGVGRTRER